jgi:hypothetical protein
VSDECIQGVGELGGGGGVEGGVVQVIEDGECAFEQFEVEAGEEAIEAAVLVFGELEPELIFGGGPFLQGFGGDVELLVDVLEVAVELFEQVEGFDFGIEPVAFGHVGLSFGLVSALLMIVQMF